MAVLIRPQLTTTKPPVGAQLNYGHPLAQGLSCFFPLNEQGGLAARDLVAGHIGVLTGTPLWSASSRGSSLDLNGSSHYLAVTDHPLLRPPEVSISLWAKFDATTGQRLVWKAFGAAGAVSYELNLAGDTALKLSFRVNSGGAGSAVGATSIATGVWYHIVAVYDGARAKIYLNGQSDADAALVTTTSYDTNALQIGRYLFGASHGGYFNGQLNDVRIYGRGLSPTEVQWTLEEPYALLLPPQPLRRYFVAPAGGPQSIDLAGSLTGAGALGNLTSKPFAGSSTGAGALAKQSQKPLAASVTAAGTLLLERVVILLLEGSIALAGTLAKGPQKALSGSSAAAGVLVHQTQKLFLAGSTAAGALAKAVSKPLAGSATATGTLDAIKTALLILTGSLAATGTLAKLSAKALAGSATGTGSLVRQAQKALTGSLAGAGTVTKAVSKALAGAITGSGAIGLVRVLLMSFAGVLTATGTMTKQADKGIGGALTPAGALTRALAVSLTGSIATAGSLAKAVAKTLAGSITATGSLDFGAAVRHIIHVLGLDRLFFQQKGADSERLDATGTDSATINRRGQDA